MMATLGKYELHELVGKGGFGTVYRATDTTLGRQVALKILHPQLSADTEFIERFRKEASLAAALENPHILVVYEIGEEAGRFYIAMRYYSGGSLADLLKRGTIGWERACAVMEQICEGVQKLHERRWVHRDLKPGNILFDADGRAVVSDFGLARALSSSSSSSGSAGAGTPQYRAPELWRGKPPASPATDVYSLGCIFAEMLTGRIIFDGDTPDEIITRHLVDGPDFGPDWPPISAPEGLRELVELAIARDPAQRPPSARFFNMALRMANGGKKPGDGARSESPQPIAVDPPAPVKPDRKLRWGLWALAGVGLLLAGLLIGIGLSSLNRQPGVSPPTAPAQIPNTASTPSQETTAAPTALSTDAAKPLAILTLTAFPSLPNLVSKKDGMLQLFVPAGNFLMGARDTDTNASSYEKPQHTVYLDSFWIDQTEVSNSQFQKCVQDNQCLSPGDTNSSSQAMYFNDNRYGDYPVIYVSWQQAYKYCRWAGRRLPSEAEWEKAARGTDGRLYPWGSDASTCALANFSSCKGDTFPVDSHGPGISIYGALNMLGNVWEWVNDWFDPNYYGASPARNPQGPDNGEYRIARGGGWDSNSKLHITARLNLVPTNGVNNIGFRCAQSENP